MDDLSRRRRRLFLLAAGMLLAALPAPSLAITPVNGGALPVFGGVDINTGPGDQYDPHVSGDLVSYTSGTTIRFYSFLTGVDAEIRPASGLEDLLSDVNGDLIAFSRVDPATFESFLHVYSVSDDRLGGVALGLPGDRQLSPSIGGGTVAFMELVTTDVFATRFGATTTRLSNDTAPDYFPAVAPSGDLIVWTKCPSSVVSCSLQQAAWDGSSWRISGPASSAVPGPYASTDGAIVAYEATLSGERHIYWQPVGGGPEERIDLPGLQSNAMVSHGVITFESAAAIGTAADLYLYDTASNRLFQITSTPSNESLNDVDVLPDGRIRVVWSSGPEGDRDVYGVTLELPPAGPSFAFGGFRSPVDPRPTLNTVKAGAGVPVKFSLGGDFGLAVFDPGNPRSQAIACDSTADLDPIEQTVTAGGSSLSYDPATGTYSYVWKTDKAWKGTCRQLVLGFADGTTARANFKFQ